MSEETIQTIDVAKVIIETVNSLCSSLISSINEKVYPLLDEIIFIDENITNDSFFEKIFGTSTSSGILMLANCLVFAFILYYCIRLLVSHFTGNEVESPGRFLLRIVFATVAMNISLEICRLLVTGASQITTFFTYLGKELFKKDISFSILNTYITTSKDFNIFSINGILSTMLSISSFALLTSFSIRYILIKVLILAAPFAFLCLANQTTEPFFKSWYRSFLSMLLVQIVLSVLLIIPYALLKENSESLFNQILLVGSISALLKSEQLVKEFFSGVGISTNFQAGISGIKSMFLK